MVDRGSKIFIISGVVLFFAVGIWLLLVNRGQQKVPGNYFAEDGKWCINQLCFFKKENKWWVKNDKIEAPANSEVVDETYKKILGIKLGEVVSENPVRFAELGIGESNRVMINIGGKELEVGKNNQAYDGTYFRPAGGNKAYFVPIILDKSNLTSLDYWQLKAITNLPIYQVRKVRISKNGVETEIVKKDDKWPNDKLVSKITYLKPVRYLPDFAKDGEKVSFTVEGEGFEVKIKIGQKTESKKTAIFWATTDDKTYFEISKEDFGTLNG